MSYPMMDLIPECIYNEGHHMANPEEMRVSGVVMPLQKAQ